MGTQATAQRDLRDLPDPDFFARWANTRHQLALTPASSPAHPEIKRRYDALNAEYRRRLDGALPSSTTRRRQQ